jgi:hypothetical protein
MRGRTGLAVILGVAALLSVSCTAPPPQPTPVATAPVRPSPSVVTEEEPTERVPLLERLRHQPGVDEGTPLPRIRHWDPELGEVYRAAFALCARIGLRDLAIQLHVDPDEEDVAIAVLDGFDRGSWRAAHQGCADGLVWDRLAG